MHHETYKVTKNLILKTDLIKKQIKHICIIRFISLNKGYYDYLNSKYLMVKHTVGGIEFLF